MEVTEGFELVGYPLAVVLATLGLPADTLVKVRRRRLPGDAGGTSLPPPKSRVLTGAHSNGSGGRGDGGGDSSNETCALEAGNEQPKGSSWPGHIDETKVSGSGRGPFARRRRTAYRLLENNEYGEEPPVTRSSLAAVGPTIEMATLRQAEQVVGDAAREESGTSTRESVGGGDPQQQHPGGQHVQDVLYDVPPEAAVRVGDVLVLSAARDVMVYAQGSVFTGRRAGLKVLGVSTLKQSPRPGSVFFELVLSRSSGFLGRSASLDNGFFAARYGCNVVAFRLKGAAADGVDLTGNGSDDGNGGAGESFSFGGGSGICSAGNRSSEGIELLETSGAYRIPKGAAAAAAAATSAVGAVADGVAGEMFTGGDDSALVDVDGGRSINSTARTHFRPSFVEGGSPTTTASLQPPPGGAGFGAKRWYPRHRRRRRKGEAFEAGDVVIVVATERFSEQGSSTTAGEFLRKKVVGRLPEPTGWFHCFPLAIFALMLAWVLLGGVEMVRGLWTNGFVAVDSRAERTLCVYVML